MTTRIFYILSALLTLGTFVFTSAAAEEIVMPNRGIAGHRGDNWEFPENTIPALEEAIRLHTAMIEFDIRITKDRQLVLMHDYTVDRTSNGTGIIFDMTLEELRKLDFGSWKDEKFAGTKIPTLDEAFAILPKDVWLNIHCEVQPDYPDHFAIEEDLALALAQRILDAGREHQAFLACTHRGADAVKAKYPQIMICNMERPGGVTNQDAYVNDTIARGADFIQIDQIPTPEQVDRLKKAGVKINFFCWGFSERVQEVFESGVDFPLIDKVSIGMQIWREMNETRDNQE